MAMGALFAHVDLGAHGARVASGSACLALLPLVLRQIRCVATALPPLPRARSKHLASAAQRTNRARFQQAFPLYQAGRWAASVSSWAPPHFGDITPHPAAMAEPLFVSARAIVQLAAAAADAPPMNTAENLAAFASSTMRQRALVGVTIALNVIGLLVVAARMFTRLRITHKFGIDDGQSYLFRYR
jgi:hypothetical protein